ncbi:hypothetical protein DJ69_16675 [Halorubrum persicum]|uniref:Uncharacterized protein n=1 Tax=Halorubrum persicum TaxID=1383844 RepID=A0A2G1WEU3_9EURY|nr:hypothetical protein DJ69_16675 [Halorubrum persicum]
MWVCDISLSQRCSHPSKLHLSSHESIRWGWFYIFLFTKQSRSNANSARYSNPTDYEMTSSNPIVNICFVCIRRSTISITHWLLYLSIILKFFQRNNRAMTEPDLERLSDVQSTLQSGYGSTHRASGVFNQFNLRTISRQSTLN